MATDPDVQELARQTQACLSDIYDFNVVMWSTLFATIHSDPLEMAKAIDDLAASRERQPHPLGDKRGDVTLFRGVATGIRTRLEADAQAAAKATRFRPTIVANSGDQT